MLDISNISKFFLSPIKFKIMRFDCKSNVLVSERERERWGFLIDIVKSLTREGTPGQVKVHNSHIQHIHQILIYTNYNECANENIEWPLPFRYTCITPYRIFLTVSFIMLFFFTTKLLKIWQIERNTLNKSKANLLFWKLEMFQQKIQNTWVL